MLPTPKNIDWTAKPSFFDDYSTPEEFTFWKPLTNYTRKFSEIKHIEGILFKKSQKTNFWKSRYYVLYDDRLAYFKVATLLGFLSNNDIFFN